VLFYGNRPRTRNGPADPALLGGWSGNADAEFFLQCTGKSPEKSRFDAIVVCYENAFFHLLQWKNLADRWYPTS